MGLFFFNYLFEGFCWFWPWFQVGVELERCLFGMRFGHSVRSWVGFFQIFVGGGSNLKFEDVRSFSVEAQKILKRSIWVFCLLGWFTFWLEVPLLLVWDVSLGQLAESNRRHCRPRIVWTNVLLPWPSWRPHAALVKEGVFLLEIIEKNREARKQVLFFFKEWWHFLRQTFGLSSWMGCFFHK